MSLLILFLVSMSSTVNSACECGYKSSTGEIWQYSITTDFNTIDNASFFNSSDWEITSLLREAGDSHPIAINYTPENIAVTNRTLILKCSAYNASSDSGIDSAEIQTTRQDILYGSFRAIYSVGGGSGAIGALFFYASDTEEVDIETLTRDDPETLHFTNQPSSTAEMNLPDKLVRNDFVSYRLDWNKNMTNFYVNNVLSNTFSTDVPTVNGSVYMNMWADGGKFAGPSPPEVDATMMVKSIFLYFNTSDTESAATWERSCQSTASLPCLLDPEVVQKDTTKSNVSQGKGGRSPSAGTKLVIAVSTAFYWSM